MLAKLCTASLILICCTPWAAQACQTGHPESLAYIRRENNRCEGLRPRDISASFQLISFTSSNLTEYPTTLNLRIPTNGSNTKPEITLQSLYRNYLADELALQPTPAGFTFSFPTDVLEKASIPVSSLRARAHIVQQSQRWYYPVILGQPSSKYKFVLYAPRRLVFPTLEIRRQGQPVANSANPRPNPTSGEVIYTWDSGNAPAGQYELYIVAEERTGTNSSRTTHRIPFFHDPKWVNP